MIGGEGRNRTRSLYRSEPNTLCFKAYFNLILQGFKSFLRPPVQRPLIAPLPPPYCSPGITLGEESGETLFPFELAVFQLVRAEKRLKVSIDIII